MSEGTLVVFDSNVLIPMIIRRASPLAFFYAYLYISHVGGSAIVVRPVAMASVKLSYQPERARVRFLLVRPRTVG